MRGAPHSGLSRLIVRIKSRMSVETAGLPTRRRDFQRQCRRKPLRCQRTSVSGLKTTAASSKEGKQPIEPDEDQAICSAQPEPCWPGPLQDDNLLAEKCRFGLASRMRSEHSDDQSAEQLQEVKHPKARIAHRVICAIPDAIFGSHR